MNKHEETLEVLRSYRKKMKKFLKGDSEGYLAYDNGDLLDAIFIAGMAKGVYDFLEKTVVSNLNWEDDSLSDEDQKLVDELTSMNDDAVFMFLGILRSSMN